MQSKFILLLLLISGQAFASVFNGNIQSFRQPDGSKVEMKLYGTEFYMRAEGLNGYTVVRDTATQWICYAQLSFDKSTLLSTGVKYSGAGDTATVEFNNLHLSKHLDISSSAKSDVINSNKEKLGHTARANAKSLDPSTHSPYGTPINPLNGNLKGICIVVDFSDEPATLPIEEFDAFCNDLGYSNFGNNGSVRTYYSDVSGGLLDYQNEVFGIFRAPETFEHYNQLPYAEGAQQILSLVLDWVDSLGFDFSTLSMLPGNDSTIMAINLMYTGEPPNWAEGMWWHQGYFEYFRADGVYSGNYNCSPANSPLGIGVVAHENGHMVADWPDTYKYDDQSGPDGIGAFDLMCWYGSSTNPVPPNPLFRDNAGWGRTVDITGFNGLISDTANSYTSYKYVNALDTDEFFMLENRKRTGRSQTIDDEGLTIWRMNRAGDNQTEFHEVYLVHADDNYENQDNACFRQGQNTEYNYNTIPYASWTDFSDSGLLLWDVSPKGTVMTYRIGASPAAISETQKHAISIFPNPTDGMLRLSADNLDLSDALASVTNLTGQLLWQGKASNGRIDISHLSNGIYNVELRMADTVFIEKVVLNK